ncbi:hypothetical protein J4730_00735 [Klebsiella pneumoniae]|uniref:Uncharacterized protein n=1 Tax=Klebsiella pneumoniae TaxID=573 RepID=A0A939SQ65_KLEPN|nr:hypothetical protein [Klebsiella pneumoniae]
MGHKFITACGCGVVKKWKNTALPLRDDTAAIAGKLSEICSRSGVERIVFGITTQKQSVIDCAGAI